MRYYYHTDPQCLRFQAQVLRAYPTPDLAGHWDVVLSNTAFYPTGGGQPCDTGTLQDYPVVDVTVARMGESPLHRVCTTAPLPFIQGAYVTGLVDETRRLDHMQQHTAQHLLSHFLSRDYGAYSLGLHIGADTSYVDISQDTAPTMTHTIAQDIERHANTWIAQNLTVDTFFPTPEQICALPLRKVPPAQEDLRIVRIGCEEAVACCGTHVHTTGMLQAVFVTGWQKSHGNTRIFFVAGGRAYVYARSRIDSCEQAAQKLSCAPPTLPCAVEKLLADKATLTQTLTASEKRLTAHLLESLSPFPCASGALYAIHLNSTAQARAALAQLTQHPNAIALLTVPDENSVFVALGVSADCTAHAGNLMRVLLCAFHGKGGGSVCSAFGRFDALELADATPLLIQHLSTKQGGLLT